MAIQSKKRVVFTDSSLFFKATMMNRCFSLPGKPITIHEKKTAMSPFNLHLAISLENGIESARFINGHVHAEDILDMVKDIAEYGGACLI